MIDVVRGYVISQRYKGDTGHVEDLNLKTNLEKSRHAKIIERMMAPAVDSTMGGD